MMLAKYVGSVPVAQTVPSSANFTLLHEISLRMSCRKMMKRIGEITEP